MIVLALSSCAHAQPSSAPLIDEDTLIHVEASSNPVAVPTCNRPAAEVLYLRHQLNVRNWKLGMLDCEERAELAEARDKYKTAELASVSWWGRYGWAVSVGALVLGAVLGGVGVFEIEKSLGR